MIKVHLMMRDRVMLGGKHEGRWFSGGILPMQDTEARMDLVYGILEKTMLSEEEMARTNFRRDPRGGLDWQGEAEKDVELTEEEVKILKQGRANMDKLGRYTLDNRELLGKIKAMPVKGATAKEKSDDETTDDR